MRFGLWLSFAVAGAAALAFAGAAQAHPHVWVTFESELVFAEDGTVSAVRHVWTFDEMYSAFATQGLDEDNDGKFTTEELAELAEVNVTSLEEFGYFTIVKSGGKTLEFGKPTDYGLEADHDNILTLRFTLPLKTKPEKAGLTIDVYDPTWFVDLGLKEEGALTLTRAPAACTAEAKRPQSPAMASANLSESFFNSLTASSEFGSQFANRITLNCE